MITRLARPFTCPDRVGLPTSRVSLVLREVGRAHPDRTFSALANGQGRLQNSEFSPEEHHLGVRFYLTATQGASEAQTTFTDAANKATFSTTAAGAEMSSFTGVAAGTCVTGFLQARQGAVDLDTSFSPRTATLSLPSRAVPRFIQVRTAEA